MSRNYKETIRCPKCGTASDMTVWESVNVTLDPDMKQDVLTGRVNMFRCPDCSYSALIPSPLLYHDMEKKLMVSFTPCNDPIEKVKKYDEFTKTAGIDELMKEFEGYNLRFVTDYNELLEKILIFDNNLNDKTVEVIKLMILSQDLEKSVDRVCRFGKKENGTLEFMIFDLKENQAYTSSVPEETYATVDDSLRQSGVKPYSFDWEIVDGSYATKLLQGYNN